MTAGGQNLLPVKPGDAIGRWTLLERMGSSTRGQMWRCRCACGRERVHAIAALRTLQKRSTVAMCKSCAQRLSVRRAARRAWLLGPGEQAARVDELDELPERF